MHALDSKAVAAITGAFLCLSYETHGDICQHVIIPLRCTVKTMWFSLETRDELVQHGIIPETIACVLAWDDAKTLDKTWCAVSLRDSHRVLSSVSSGVIGMSCLHDLSCTQFVAG